MMIRFTTLALVAYFFCHQFAWAGEAKKPNIVIVLADDMGWHDR